MQDGKKSVFEPIAKLPVSARGGATGPLTMTILLLTGIFFAVGVYAGEPELKKGLCEGEELGIEWLGESQMNVHFDGEETLFQGDASGGGSVFRVEYPAGTGNYALMIEETSSSGNTGNAASSFRWRIEKNTAFCGRVNEILSLPENGDPVYFIFSFRLARETAASRLVWAECSAEWLGARRPCRWVFCGERDLRKLPGYREHGGFAEVNAGLFPSLRFAVYPSGGKYQIDGLDLRFNVRVDTGSGDETLAIDDLAMHELVSAPRPEEACSRTVAFVGSAPSAAFLQAARRFNCKVLPTLEKMDAEADIYVIDRQLNDPALARQCADALRNGKILVIGMEKSISGVPRELEDCLPVNAWSCAHGNLLRYGTSLLVKPGSSLFKSAGLPAMAIQDRVDLHLPFAPIETPLHRYEWPRYGKNLLNTDWHVHLTCGIDGGLPALIEGRCGPGKVFVFAGSLFDPVLLQSPGYPVLAETLLKAVPDKAAVSGKDPKVDVKIAPHQPEGLHVKLRNRGNAGTKVVLLYKIRNWARELRNSASIKVAIPAGGEVSVPLMERHPDIGSPGISSSCEEKIPLRRVEVGIAPLDRGRLLSTAEGAVSLAQPVSICFEEDNADFAEMKDWPMGQIVPDGAIGYRYVYRTGTSPLLHMKLRNGIMNISPLAQAKDLQVPENWSANGLNDLSYTHSSVRGSVPLQGGWSGTPAPEQKIALCWKNNVQITGFRLVGQGTYRSWNVSNPRNFSVIGKSGKDETVLEKRDDAPFAGRYGDVYAFYDASFENSATVDECQLHVTGLDPSKELELKHWKKKDRGEGEPSNCTLLEWEVYGWPHEKAPPAVNGKLKATMRDLLSGKENILMEETVELPGLQELARDIRIPARTAFGPVRLDVTFADGSKIMARSSLDVLFVPAEGRKLEDKDSLIDYSAGLLCSPGWVACDGFGKGIVDQTQGWGGPDDKIWAYTNNLMMIGDRNRDKASCMFTSCTAATHYTNPFRNMPNGVYSWEMVSHQMLADLEEGGCWAYRLKDKNGDGVLRFHVFGSDAWNGLNIGGSWGWGEFIDFDRYLRAKGGKGLQGRTISAIVKEIRGQYGKDWQVWQMNRYADQMLATQDLFRENGIEFTFESHGSFPLCGGDIGEKIARTHIAVGTDLFWELRNQDLIWSLGSRFAIVAANPDLRSGAYNEWGWINSEANQWWYANNGSAEPARRQWYATYFTGRVTLEGTFEPYHVFGFSSQGGVGTQMNPDDIRECERTINLTTQVRPEKATGFGMVVSWANQELHMGEKLGRQGFGLYAGEGYEQIDDLMANIYHRLVKNGLPVSFFTSTHGLKKWNGAEPLVLVDGYNLCDWELDAVKRLNAAGAPILAIGEAEAGRDLSGSAAFYGATQDNGVWKLAPDVRTVSLDSAANAYVRTKPGAGPVVFVPTNGKDLGGIASAQLVKEMMALTDRPLSVPTGIAATPFVSQGNLFLALLDQGDDSREVAVGLRPEWFLPALKGKTLRVIDMDRAEELRADKKDGRLEFKLKVPASSGRMVMIAKGEE